MSENIYANLPRIVLLTGVEDAGEFGAAECPHCGAKGRYIYTFRCEGHPGETFGAMRGCFSHFKQHPFVKEQVRLADKKSRYAPMGWKLPAWDLAIEQAIIDYADGVISEAEAIEVIRAAKHRAELYRQNHRH